MKKIKLKHKKLILAYIILLILPLIATLLFVFETWTNNAQNVSTIDMIKDINFIYSYISTWWMLINWSFIGTIFAMLYNFIILLFFYNISTFTKKHLLKIAILFWFIISLYWYISFWILMSV